MPLVSVIMPVYNGEKYLAAAIDSILEQTFTDFEFLIIDDASQDRSLEIMRDYEDRDARIQVFQLDENGGPNAARNRAIAGACGKYVATMDQDDVGLPERLEKQVEFMQANPGIGLLGAWAQCVGPNSEPMFAMEPPSQHSLIALNILIGACFVHPTTMFRRSNLEAVGGYGAAYPITDEIVLYIRLLADRQIRFANLQEILLLYRVHPHGLSRAWDNSALRRNTVSSALEQLWGEQPDATVNRFNNLYKFRRLSWVERREAKRDLLRLIDSMIAKSWVEAGDRPLLIAAMNHRLEQASPRLWQQFCHWRRRRLGF